jgi:hypothetical protein
MYVRTLLTEVACSDCMLTTGLQADVFTQRSTQPVLAAPHTFAVSQPPGLIHTKHINTLCGQNVKFVNVKRGGAYSNHWALLRVDKHSVP